MFPWKPLRSNIPPANTKGGTEFLKLFEFHCSIDVYKLPEEMPNTMKYNSF